MRDGAKEAPVDGPLPRHVAMIMDGNGRWALKRTLPRQAGHAAGISAVRRTVETACELGLDYLTLYAFSTENWRRPQKEISGLMELFRRYFDEDMARLAADNVRIRIIGSSERLDADIAAMVADAETRTAANTGLNLTFAFNYGAREELAGAARALAREVAQGRIAPDAIDTELFSAHLQSGMLPDVDLIIRTSGEQRVSNFLLWQAAYAELVFVDALWPDFGRADFVAALQEYAGRERRFGGLTDVDDPSNGETDLPPLKMAKAKAQAAD
jgi:undecaprenyl diphosphate synthase